MADTISRFIDMPTVAERLSCSARTVEEMVKRGDFPRPTKVGPRLNRWPEETFQRWAAERCQTVAA